MVLSRFVVRSAIVAMLAGCQAAAQRSSSTIRVVEPTSQSATNQDLGANDPAATYSSPSPAQELPPLSETTVSYEQESLPTLPNEPARPNTSRDSLHNHQLTLSWLTNELQARNPSLQAMASAWQAAAARYPQAVSLDDPMFMAMAAPASFGSEDVEDAWGVQLNQKFPWFGKRAARGRQAAAEANAAYHDLRDSRLQLDELASIAFYDYYLARRGLELNRENVAVMESFRTTAQAKYRANQVTQQDELQAAVELAELEREQIELDRQHRVAVARINTLLRASPFDPLPPPPSQLQSPATRLDRDALQTFAESQRPDLAALAARVRAEQAAVTLACKEYYPDVDVFGRYDTFWQPADTQSDLRPQVGATINLPLYRGRLNAAVREAMFRLNRARAEYEQRRLDVSYEVANAAELVEESRRAVALYSEKLVPATQQNIAAASANYEVGKVSFLELAAAQRQAIELRRKQEESLATYHIRLAQLTRVVGGPLPPAEDEQQLTDDSP